MVDVCLVGRRVRPMEREPLDALVLCGHSFASFNRGWGWSRSDRGVSRRDLLWVDVGTLDRGQLEMGMVGGTIREGL